MSAEEFEAWLEEMGFSGLEAAKRLGVSKNSVVKYRTEGAPGYIRLACAALRGTAASETQRHKYQHEAGDRAFVVAQHFSDFVQAHPFIAERPDLSAMADQVGDALGKLYQAIWKAEQ